MKKTLLTLLAIIGGAVSMYAAGENKLTLDKAVYEVPAGGGTTTVTVNYAFSSDIKALQASFSFPEGIDIERKSNGKVICTKGTYTTAHSISAGTDKITMQDMEDNAAFAPASGTMFSFNVNVASTVEEDYYTATLTGIKLTENVGGSNQSVTLGDVTIKIKVGNPKTPIDDAVVTLSGTKFTYTGSAIEPTITSVKLDGATLTEGTDFSVSYQSNVDAGTGKVVLTGLATPNFYKGTAVAEFTIEKATSAITVDPAAISGLTYTGSAQTLATTGTCVGGDLLYSLDGETYGATIPQGTDAGAYTVYYKVDGGKNYKGVEAKSLTATIAKATSTLATAPSAVSGLAYTGSAQALVTAGSGVVGGKLVYSLDGTTFAEAIPTATDAGTYTVSYKVDGGKNYEGVAVATLSDITIAQVPATITTIPAVIAGLTYSGEEQELITAGVAEGGELQYSLDGGAYSTALPKGKDKKAYVIGYKVVGDKNHTDVAEATLNTAIVAKEVVWTTTDAVPSKLIAEVTNEANKTAELTNIVLGSGATTLTLTDAIDGYTLTSIPASAFTSVTGVQDIILPETETILPIGDGALPTGANIKVAQAQLADYALAPALQNNFEAGKVKATLTAANDYFTLSAGVDVLLPEGTEAFACKLFDASKVLVNAISESELTVDSKKVIKANNGVLLKGAKGTEYEIVAVPGTKNSGDAVTTDNAMSYSDNELEPVIVATNFASGSYYALKNNEFHAILDNTSKVPAGKAVLKVNGAAARVLGLMGAGVTRINGIDADGLDKWYDLQGNRIDRPMKKGIYILNGSKVTVK